MISQTTEYALRAVVTLAAQPGAPMLTRDLAAKTKVPAGYLSKVLQTLGRAGLVQSQHGVGGGFVLARPVDSISLYDVVQAVDPIQRILTCPLGLASHGKNLCALHRKLDNTMRTVEESLRNITLTELLAERDAPSALCSVGASNSALCP